jgi:N-acetylneuraminic acid mutarotase
VSARLALAVVLLLAGCVGAATDSLAPIDQRAPGHWMTVAPLPTARQEVAVAAFNGYVFVMGGLGETAEPVATVQFYDPAENRWAPRAPLPVPLHHAAAAVVANRLFVVGGYTGGRVRWTASAGLYEYDLLRDAWTARPEMPTARGGLAAAALGDRLHVLGGAADHPTSAHEVYDPATNAWSVANALPTARDHLAAVALQGRLWAIGGRTGFWGEQYASVDVYDPATDSWRTGTPLPAGRGGLAAAVLDDRVYVFGGEAPFRAFRANEMFEAAGNRWIAKESMPTARHGIGAAVVGNRIFIPGGGTQPGFAPTIAHDAYTP